MQARKAIGSLAIVAIVAMAVLVGVWLFALAGSAEQFRSLLRLSAGTAVQAADAPTRSAATAEPPLNGDAPPPSVPDSSAEGLAEEDAGLEARAGPIDGAAFAELLESGLLDESDDRGAAEELRDALHKVAEAGSVEAE
jgi:hypothetical protein